ncbi:MAG: hypothetical protein ACK5DE_13620 [Bacteroidota bacterium]
MNALAVGAPLDPGRRIFSLLPSLIRFLLAWMLAYSPGFTWTSSSWASYFASGEQR